MLLLENLLQTIIKISDSSFNGRCEFVFGVRIRILMCQTADVLGSLICIIMNGNHVYM